MDLAMDIADIALSRAGAHSLSENIFYELPVFLIPYPYAKNHQEANAQFFQNEVKGGRYEKQKELTPKGLAKELNSLWENREHYRCNIQNFKHKIIPKNFVDLIAHKVQLHDKNK